MKAFLATNRVAVLAASTVVLLGVGGALAFFYAPAAPGYFAHNDPNGLDQRIFYFHVSIALTAYVAFGWGAWKALLRLWKGSENADLESYVAIHQGVIFGSLTLLTGSVWAKIAWGVWWNWGDTQLTLFLVLFLFYSAYFMLRFSVEDGPSRANMSAVYALFGAALIPVSYLAIHLGNTLIHPTVFTSKGPQMVHQDFIAFCFCLAGMVCLFATLYQLELSGKRLDRRLRDLRELLA